MIIIQLMSVLHSVRFLHDATKAFDHVDYCQRHKLPRARERTCGSLGVIPQI